MTSPVPKSAPRAALKILRVGDGVLYHHAGRWATKGYYQYNEVLSAFARAAIHVRLCAFGRVLEEQCDAATPVDMDRLRPGGLVVPGRGLSPLVRNWRDAIHTLRADIQSADVVWAMLPSFLGLLAVELSQGKKPCVTHLVGDPRRALAARSQRFRDRCGSLVAASLVRRAIGKADGAIFVSQALRSAYLSNSQRYSIVANESRVTARQIIDPADLLDRPSSTDTDGLSLIYVGRLAPEKGCSVLIQALSRTPNVILDVVGDGPDRRKLEQLAASLNLNRSVRFLGPRRWDDDLLRYISEHSALVLPSLTEGLGLVLIEAMSQGVPIIASSVGGIPEIVQQGVTGLLVPPGDAGGLAAAIARLQSDPPLRYRLAAAGLQVAKSHTAQAQYGKAAQFIIETMDRKQL